MARIAVVGAGIAGTAAALALAREGHRVELFERAPAPGPVGAGLLLQPSGQAALATLGLLDAITSRSEKIAELRAEQLSGRTLIRIPYAAADATATGFGVGRGLLFTTLFDAARAAGVTVTTGVAMTRHEVRAGEVFLSSADGAQHGPFEFVLAADGGRSALRESSGLPFRRHDSKVGALWAVASCSSVRNYLYQGVRGTRHLIGLLPIGGGRASFFWGDRSDTIDALRADGFAAFRERVLRMVPRAAEIFGEFTEFSQANFLTYTHIRCPRWSGDRLLLLGDAAHSMSPHLGQGANLALADAVAFARTFAATGDFASAARAYEAERRPPAEVLSRLSFFLTPFFQSKSRILGWGRDLALPLLSSIPPIRRLMARTLAGRLGGKP